MLVKNFRFSLLYTKRAKQYTYMNNNRDTPLIQCFRNIDLLVIRQHNKQNEQDECTASQNFLVKDNNTFFVLHKSEYRQVTS